MKKALAAGLAVVSIACADSISPVPELTSAVRVASVISAAAPEAVVPSGYTAMMGTSNNSFPHAFRNLRYQQVFLGSDLVDPTIVGLCLRRDEVPGGTTRVQTLNIKLGPTSLDYTNLSGVFDANYSAPPTEVFSGDVTVPANVAGGTPADFDLCIPFTQEYVHPAGSNVIVEVVNSSALSGNTPKDACTVAEDACTTTRAYAFSTTATNALFVERGGLVMKFVSPEPPAPVDPATMDECKKGGWANFGFRNQGQCIRFVETGQDSRSEETES